MGHFIHDDKWHAVYLRAQEVAGACSIIMTRWANQLTDKSVENLTLAREQAESIATVAIQASRTQPTKLQFNAITQSQSKLNELISQELGEAQGVIERSPEENV